MKKTPMPRSEWPKLLQMSICIRDLGPGHLKGKSRRFKRKFDRRCMSLARRWDWVNANFKKLFAEKFFDA